MAVYALHKNQHATESQAGGRRPIACEGVSWNKEVRRMKHQIPLDAAARADTLPKGSRGSRARQVLPDIACKRLAIVNVAFFGLPGRTRTAVGC